jgi:hypothetical protein
MSGASGPPVSAAAALFRRLGYTVREEGREFEARRKWRTVAVTVLDDEASPPALADGGDRDDGPALRCYVTAREGAERLRERLDALDPTGDWAVVGVGDGGHDHEVVRAP